MPQTYAALSEFSKVPISTLWHRAHGRPSRREKADRQQYLSPSEEKGLVKYALRMADLGYPVPVKFLPSLAFIIASQRAHSVDEVINPLGKNWSQAFYKRHPELRSRRVKALDSNRHDCNIYGKITHWFEVIGKELHDPVILQGNVYNMDETGVMLSMLSSLKVLVGKHDPRAYRGAGVKRMVVTAIECISADGRSLLPMIIWPATTHRSNWTMYPTPGWHYAHSESGYTDSKISLEWLIRVFDPQTKARAHQKPRILICDGFGTHETLEILQYCFENNIILCRIPSHTSHKLQPCDIGVFSPLKAAYREQVEKLYRRGSNTVGKEHFTALYSTARDKALTPKNIHAGWIKAGLYPFNPDKVLKDIQKPQAELTIAKTIETRQVMSTLQIEQLQTPVTAEDVTLLHDIIQQGTQELDETSRKCLKKLANAAHVSLAECALLQDENLSLFKQNDEVRRRKATKSTVIGKAKVMSYEDIQEAQAKRAAKEVVRNKAPKGTRRQKRKTSLSGVTKVAKVKKNHRSQLEAAAEEIVATGLSDYCSVFQIDSI